jgi:hypothetical protein
MLDYEKGKLKLVPPQVFGESDSDYSGRETCDPGKMVKNKDKRMLVDKSKKKTHSVINDKKIFT